MRTITKFYNYSCDVQGYRSGCDAEEEIQIGDAIPAYVGALFPNIQGKVRTAEDADKVMRRRYGWAIGGAHLCSEHA